MRRLLFMIALGSLAGMTAASAQVFSHLSDCDKRYGKAIPPTDLTSDVRFYQTDGITVKILFVDDKAAVVTFTTAAPKKMESATQTKLLDSNAGGQHWEPVEGEGTKTWRRSDGLAFGIYDPNSGELTVMSTDYLEKNRDLQPVSTR